MTAPALRLKPVLRTPAPKLTGYQVQLMKDMDAGDVISWTFVPGNVKPALYQLVFVHKLARLDERTVGSDPRVYQFAVLTERGQQVLEDMR